MHKYISVLRLQMWQLVPIFSCHFEWLLTVMYHRLDIDESIKQENLQKLKISFKISN